MKVEDMTHVQTYGALDRAFASANSRFEALRRTITEYRQYRKTYEELERLNDRELADLGILRCDIGRIARDAVYGA